MHVIYIISAGMLAVVAATSPVLAHSHHHACIASSTAHGKKCSTRLHSSKAKGAKATLAAPIGFENLGSATPPLPVTTAAIGHNSVNSDGHTKTPTP